MSSLASIKDQDHFCDKNKTYLQIRDGLYFPKLPFFSQIFINLSFGANFFKNQSSFNHLPVAPGQLFHVYSMMLSLPEPLKKRLNHQKKKTKKTQKPSGLFLTAALTLHSCKRSNSILVQRCSNSRLYPLRAVVRIWSHCLIYGSGGPNMV